jgi:LysR family hydrogen peroxide-inducible transcriptional activator
MSTQLPSTKQLRYLVALDEYRHFGKAAAACFVSQSAFSIAIREVESLLGVRLFDRTNKRVTVTKIGQDIAVHARLCLRDLASLVEVARRGGKPLTGRLHLGVIPTIAPFLLPQVLPSLKKKHGALEIYLREDVTKRIYEALMAGELDAILVALPYELRNVHTVVLFKDHFRLACRSGTRLVDPKRYAATRLENDSVLLLEDGHCMRDHALKACRIRNLNKVNRFSATSMHTLVQMVDSDLGITFLPEIIEGSTLLRNTQVRTYPLKEGSYREVALAWRKGSGRGEEFRLLADLFKAHQPTKQSNVTSAKRAVCCPRRRSATDR